MRFNITGGLAVFALVSLAFSSEAAADSIRLSALRLAPGLEVSADAGRPEGRPSFGAGFGMEVASRQFGGRWDFEKANPFRHQDNRRQFDRVALDEVRNFLGQPSVPAPAPPFTLPVDQGKNDAGSVVNVVGVDLTGLGPALEQPPFTPAAVGPASEPLPTPEPASLILLGSGLVGLGVFGARRKRGRVRS